MRYLKYILLILIIFNIPTFILSGLENSNLSSIVSYLFFILLIIYYFMNNKQKVALPFILIGLSYYFLSISQSISSPALFYIATVKYFIIIVCGYELVKRCSKKELYILLLLASLTILIQPIFFPDDYGRAGGVYINPNTAGFICLIGYCLTFAIHEKYLKLIGQIIFTFTGLLTFSRTFIVLWFMINLISLWINIKNIRVFLIGIITIAFLFSFAQLFGLSNVRLEQIQDVINAKAKMSEINDDSRTDTWAQYYPMIISKPILGNGFGTFAGTENKEGVHNSYLLVLGEAGIIPFVIFSGFFLWLVYRSFKVFKKEPFIFLFSFSIALFLLTNHNFFSDYNMIFFSLWIYYQLQLIPKKTANETSVLNYAV